MSLLDPKPLLPGKLDEAVTELATTPGSAFATAQSATYAPAIAELEAAPVYAYGHSMVAGQSEVAGSKWVDRVKSRLRTLDVVNNAVSGTNSGQIAAKVITTWTPGNRGLVLLQSIFNNVQHWTSLSSAGRTTRETHRTIYATLSAGQAFSETSAAFAYSGHWVDGPTVDVMGGTSRLTQTIGSFVDVAWTGDAAYVLTQFGTSATAGTVEVRDSTTNTVVQTVNTGTYSTSFPGVIKLAGYGAGPHSVRITLTSGTGFTVDALLIPNPNPPKIIHVKEGPVLVYNSGYTADVAAGNAILAGTYQPAVDVLQADFPNVLMTPNGGPVGWDAATMCSFDGLHPNAKGSAKYADAAVQALGRPGWVEGLNPLYAPFSTTATVPAYVGTPTLTVYARDDFNRADSTTTLGSTPIGNKAWSYIGGGANSALARWGIKSNQAYSSAAYGDILAVVDVGLASAVAKIDIKTRSDVGLVFRVQDENNFFMVWGDISANVYKVMKKIGGGYTTIFTSAVAVVSGDKVEAVTSGDTITVYVNNVQVWTGTDAALNTATRYGIRLSVIAGNFGTESAARFDNFVVQSVR